MKLYFLTYSTLILGSVYLAISYYNSTYTDNLIKTGLSAFLAFSFSVSLYDKIKN